MDFSKQQNTRTVQSVVAFFGILVIAGAFAVTGANGEQSIFKLQFNPFALFSLAGILITLSFLFVSTRVSIRGSEAVWFNVFVACITVFAVSEFFMRMSATKDGFIFWDRLQAIGALECSAAFLFLLNYLNPRIKHVRTTVFLLVGSILVFLFFGSTNTLVLNTQQATKWYPWGYFNDPGPGYMLFFLWIISISFASIYLIIKFLRHNKNPILDKQMKLFLAAFLLPLLGSLVTEYIIPAVTGQIVFSLHVIFGAISAGLMLWGLNRYHVFRVSPAMISEEILTLMSESVVVVNRELKIEFVNQETEQLLRRAGSALQQRMILDFLTKQSGENLMDGLKDLHDDSTITIDNIEIENDEHEKTYARISVSRVTEENGIDGYILVITDVTELKNSYDALEKEKASVDHTVHVRTKELREAQARLIESDKMKTEFVLLTSHNLRTPLAAIKGNIELLGMPSMGETERANFIDDLKNAAVKLGDLVEDLLTISTIEAGDSVVRETTTLDAVFDKLSGEAEASAKASGNKFVAHITAKDIPVTANAHQIQTALRNMLDNAFKFTKEGRVTFSVAAHKGQMVITIADTGIGISKEELPKLFTKFHRATSAMQYDYDGEGIGLYLSKLIIEEHGGKIGVISNEGKGTTFTVTLPTASKSPSHRSLPPLNVI